MSWNSTLSRAWNGARCSSVLMSYLQTVGLEEGFVLNLCYRQAGGDQIGHGS